jgi:hypothetical protein
MSLKHWQRYKQARSDEKASIRHANRMKRQALKLQKAAKRAHDMGGMLFGLGHNIPSHGDPAWVSSNAVVNDASAQILTQKSLVLYARGSLLQAEAELLLCQAKKATHAKKLAFLDAIYKPNIIAEWLSPTKVKTSDGDIYE